MTILDQTTVASLLRRLDRLRPETRPLWGKMSAHQMLCHLNDSFALAMGQKTASEEITFIRRTVVRWMAFRLPLRWPQGVPTRPEMDQQIGGTRPVDFASDSATLVAAIQRFERKPRDFRFGRHPVFGELSEWEWMRWGYLHADHHLRQFRI